MRMFVFVAALVAALALVCSPSSAGQDLLVGSDVGGSPDAVARVFAGSLGLRVVNKPGAAGVVAMNHFQAKAEPGDVALFANPLARKFFAGPELTADPQKFETLAIIGLSTSLWIRDSAAPPFVIGTRGAPSPSDLLDFFALDLFAIPVRTAPGYKSQSDIGLSVEREETDFFVQRGALSVPDKMHRLWSTSNGDMPIRSVFLDRFGYAPSGKSWEAYLVMERMTTVVSFQFSMSPNSSPSQVTVGRERVRLLFDNPSFVARMGAALGGRMDSYEVGVDASRTVRQARVTDEMRDYMNRFLGSRP